MPRKYHVHVKAAPLETGYLFKFRIVRRENCINCGRCTKVCIYEAHRRRPDDPRKMADPNTEVCRNCFRCIQECPRGALEKSLNPEFLGAGGAYWRPDTLLALWKQADDGRVPVTGAGYRGPFTGTGFDSMWTDMSEIVRPTRDGIHGREYISTSVGLGRRLDHLEFDQDGRLRSRVPRTLDLPLPVIFDLPEPGLSSAVRTALMKAAAELDTCLVVPAAQVTAELMPSLDHLIPCLTPDEIDHEQAVLARARLVAVDFARGSPDRWPALHARIRAMGSALTIVRVPATATVEETVAGLARQGAEIIQVVADYRGREIDSPSPSSPRLLKDIIRAVHLRLVADRIRDEVTLIASGGIAMAEHVPKAMLCGADLVAIDLPLLVALGARVQEEPARSVTLPREIEGVAGAVLTQRIVNLMGAWHSQLLEVMGAMGIREARRLRGESGRAIFFEEIDHDTFGKLFRRAEAAHA